MAASADTVHLWDTVRATEPGLQAPWRLPCKRPLPKPVRTSYLTPPMARTPAGTPSSPTGSARFLEENATASVRGGQPDIDAGIDAIREVVRTLKPKPGVYRMHDAKGDVLYVGKARALKNRVANYVQVDRLSNRLTKILAEARKLGTP